MLNKTPYTTRKVYVFWLLWDFAFMVFSLYWGLDAARTHSITWTVFYAITTLVWGYFFYIDSERGYER